MWSFLFSHKTFLFLSVLDVTDCYQLTSRGVQYLEKQTALTELYLANCKNITDDCLQSLFRACVNLTVVDMSYLKDVTVWISSQSIFFFFEFMCFTEGFHWTPFIKWIWIECNIETDGFKIKKSACSENCVLYTSRIHFVSTCLGYFSFGNSFGFCCLLCRCQISEWRHFQSFQHPLKRFVWNIREKKMSNSYQV